VLGEAAALGEAVRARAGGGGGVGGVRGGGVRRGLRGRALGAPTAACREAARPMRVATSRVRRSG
jgi:hypothetical protein